MRVVTGGLTARALRVDFCLRPYLTSPEQRAPAARPRPMASTPRWTKRDEAAYTVTRSDQQRLAGMPEALEIMDAG